MFAPGRRKAACAVFAFVALVLTARAAPAQDGADLRAPGRLNAQAFRDVPADGSIRVQPYDDTRDSRRIQQAIERAVERKGRHVDNKAGTLALNFETGVQQIGRTGPPPSLGSIQADRDDARVRLNLYSTSEDNLVTGRRSEGGGSGSVKFTLTLSLDDSKGTRLWQGTATLLGTPNDEIGAYASMARALIDEFGQTARQKPFRID
ncbi:MAG: hypothetical protein GC202_00775 [Alphaproteobacteria bacterium]|nr:hypothetical protein [Alphaproteobacteria bacterium]